jgi:kynurenine formamidase
MAQPSPPLSREAPAEVPLWGPLCRAVDLGYELNAGTVYWPGGEGFCLCVSTSGASPAGGANDFYAAGTFSCAEHGGTHVDAPFHFYEHGDTVEKLSLNQLIGCARVVRTQQTDVTPEVILSHEAEHGTLPRGCIFLCETDWARNYAGGAASYLGHDEAVQGAFDPAVHTLRFPGVTRAAAELLVARGVAAVGLDTASLDPGGCKTFDAHRVLLAAGVYGIENLTGELRRLPPRGSTVMAMPLKLTGGSGAPARVVAFLPPVGWQ